MPYHYGDQAQYYGPALLWFGVGPGGQSRYKTIQSEFQASTKIASKLLNNFE